MRLLFGIFALLFLPGIQAFSAEPAVPPGYLNDVSLERDSHFHEIFIFEIAPPQDKKLNELIFNTTLSKEFKEKYRAQFGQLDTESIVYQPTKFTNFDQNHGADMQTEQRQQTRQAFAEYMMKRLFEWHADNYFKTEPSMRPIYETKEKLSNVQVQLNKETKINIRYNLSDNTADIVCDNPYLDKTWVSILMDPKKFGPADVLEQKVTLEKKISRNLRVNSNTLTNDGITSLEFVRMLKTKIPGSLSTNFIASTPIKDTGISARENHYQIGLTHSY